MELNNKNDKNELMTYFSFNEDSTSISIGTKEGFKIIALDPINNYIYRKIGREINIVEIYHSSNILLLVGAKENSLFPPNKLIIWDDNKREIVGELRTLSKIKVAKIIKDKLFIVNDINIFIFNFDQLSLIDSFEIYCDTKDNVSFAINNNIIKIAYLSENKTNIKIKEINYLTNESKEGKTILNDKDLKYNLIKFNNKGNLIAGTCENTIYLYNALNKEKIKEIENETFGNGRINDIRFSRKDNYMAISVLNNNSGKILIYDITSKDDEDENNLNFLNYFFKKEENCCYFILNTNKFIFKFDEDNYIIIITSLGEYIKISFNLDEGGKCQKIENKKIFP